MKSYQFKEDAKPTVAALKHRMNAASVFLNDAKRIADHLEIPTRVFQQLTNALIRLDAARAGVPLHKP